MTHQPPDTQALATEWDWQLSGACVGLAPELFFSPWGERGPSRARRVAAAKAVCAECPVRKECADYALAGREAYGVWGGLSEPDREQLLGIRFG